MSSYNPSTPILLLNGEVGSISNKDLYGINDGTGLENIYATYDLTIDTIAVQSIGDESTRSGVARQYTGFDIKVGDFVAQVDGTGAGRKILRIKEISSKASSEITCVVEDVDMVVARTSSGRDNKFPLVLLY